MKKIALIVFWVSVAGVLLSEMLMMSSLRVICKPLIMTSLMTFYYVSVARENRSGMLIVAMLFSLAGDVFLLRADFFIAGLSAFLLSHIAYIVTYRHHQSEERADNLRGLQRVRMAFPILLAGTGLVVILYPVLNEMKIPVILYATVITTMVLTALFRFGRTNERSYWMVFGGAVLFMLSDAILAINKFLTPIEFAGIYIMTTYSTAQYFIVTGLSKHADR